jgi:hypothetical protein
MKSTLFYGIFFLLTLLSNISLTAQNNGLSVNLHKVNQKIYTFNSVGKHEIIFEITGIFSQKQADNLIKQVRGFRGVEEFNLIQRQGTNIWDATGTFYEYANDFYFKNLFGIMNVTDVKIDNITSSLDKL